MNKFRDPSKRAFRVFCRKNFSCDPVKVAADELSRWAILARWAVIAATITAY